MTRYEQGFLLKCAEYGVNGPALLKKAIDMRTLMGFFRRVANGRITNDKVMRAVQKGIGRVRVGQRLGPKYLNGAAELTARNFSPKQLSLFNRFNAHMGNGQRAIFDAAREGLSQINNVREMRAAERLGLLADLVKGEGGGLYRHTQDILSAGGDAQKAISNIKTNMKGLDAAHKEVSNRLISAINSGNWLRS